jgi:ubiquitin carboxyl-terminal hydrolase 14
MYNFCTDNLKKTLDHGRDYEKKLNEEKVAADQTKFEVYKKNLEASGKLIPEDTRELYKKFKEEKTEDDIKEHDEKLYRKPGSGLETGNYELVAVLTHQGRTSDSGHYVGWVHFKGGISG